MHPTRARIVQRLEELDRDQAWLARQVGVSLALVTRWLNGERSISEEHMRLIAVALHRPIKWFTTEPKQEAVA